MSHKVFKSGTELVPTRELVEKDLTKVTGGSVNKDKDTEDSNKAIDPTVVENFYKSMCSYHIDFKEAERSTFPFKFVMAGNGIFKITKNEVGSFIQKVDKVLGLPDLTESVNFNVPRIPYILWEQTIAFFRKIMALHNDAEAMLQFYYDKDNGKYIVHCPEQTISGAHIDFIRSAEMDSKYLLVMDIHSHNSMGAFFSTTDNNDEKESRIYGVVGQLNRSDFSYKFRVMISGEARALMLSDIFEVPEMSDIHVPEEWLNNCKKKTYTSIISNRYKTKYGVYDWDHDISMGGMYSDLYDDNFYSKTYKDKENAYQDKDLKSGTTDSTKSVSGEFYSDIDITKLSVEARMEILKDFLMFYEEELAYAIYREDKLELLEAFCDAFEEDDFKMGGK